MAVWKIKTEYIAGENQAIYLSTAQLLKASAEKLHEMKSFANADKLSAIAVNVFDKKVT